MFIVLKIIHILASTLFLGAGLASVFYKLYADKTGDVSFIARVCRAVVIADMLFIIPSGIILPVTGIGMMHAAGYSFTDPWIMHGFALYILAGLTWLPAAFLQVRMRNLSEAAVDKGEALPPLYFRSRLIWCLLGIPSFFAAIGVFVVMVGRY